MPRERPLDIEEGSLMEDSTGPSARDTFDALDSEQASPDARLIAYAILAAAETLATLHHDTKEEE
jgi:hypothetical protein